MDQEEISTSSKQRTNIFVEVTYRTLGNECHNIYATYTLAADHEPEEKVREEEDRREEMIKGETRIKREMQTIKARLSKMEERMRRSNTYLLRDWEERMKGTGERQY